MQFVNKRDLYCDEYKAFILCEYKKELRLIKKLINISEDAIEKQDTHNTWSYEGICHSFAKTIVDCSKKAYDNLILGHFDVVHMISRVALENLVCLDVIMSNQDFELCKYYWAYSHYHDLQKNKKTGEIDFSKLFDIFDWTVSEDFYMSPEKNKKGKKMQPYIERSYGWTYKINPEKQFSFNGLCNLLDDKAAYDEFGLLSEYSHGTSFYRKLQTSIGVDNMMFIFVNMYWSLYRMVTIYCWDKVNEDFDNVTDELEFIFHRYIQYKEGLRNDFQK
jgi:hypothetical protein